MKKITIIWFLLILPFLSISQKVKVSWNTTISDSETYNDALNKAINDAKEEALRKAGVDENISSFTSLSVLEDNESFKEVFNSEIFSNMTGSITKWNFIKGPDKGFDTKSNSPTISFTIEAKVKKYKTKKDPAFKAKVEGIKSSYKNDEQIEFNIKFYQDSYLNVFYISSQESSILYPIEKHYENKLYNKNDIKSIDWIKAETEELAEYGKFLIVITKENYPYINTTKDEGGYLTKTNLDSIMEWLFTIEPDNRDEYFYEFIISKD